MSAISPDFNSAVSTWDNYRSDFFKALQTGDKDAVTVVAARYPEAVNWSDKNGGAPLHIAFDKRDKDMFRHLLDLGAHPSQRQEYRSFESFFIKEPVEIICRAAYQGEKEYVHLLLAYGASGETYNNGIKDGKIPAAVRYDILDMLAAAGRIRKEFKASLGKPAPQSAATPPVPATAAATQEHIDVLKPAKVQRRAANSASP